MKRTIRAGAVEETYTFLAPDRARPRGRRVGTASKRKQDSNEFQAEKRLARLLNANFRHNDILLTLTYDEDRIAGPDADAVRSCAMKDLSRFLERMKYHAGKAGTALSKYIAVTSDINGDTGEYVKIHHHLVLPASIARFEDGKILVGKTDLEKLWGKGACNLRLLHDQDDLTPVAQYLLRQVRRVPDHAKYRAARGMEKPVITDEEIVSGTRELRAPKGARILYKAAYEPGRPQYIRYVRKQAAKGRRRE